MRLLIIALALAAVSLTACGKKEEKAGVSVTPGGMVVRGKDGSTVEIGRSAGKLPDFAPLYAGARVESTVAGIKGGGADGGTLFYRVKATPDEVVAFYKDRTAAAGLKAESDMNLQQARMFMARDETTSRMLQVMVSAEGGDTGVQLLWATGKP